MGGINLMNWTDVLVIAIIGGFILLGVANGFLMSAFRIVSFFISTVLSVKSYPLLANALVKSSMYENIKKTIYDNLMKQQQAQAPGVNKQIKEAAANQVLDKLQLPGFLKDNIAVTLKDKTPDLTEYMPIDSIVNAISEQLTKVVIDIISVILIFILVRVALIFAKFLIKGITKLPLFKQMDKVGGIALGALEGFLVVYVVFAFAMLFHSAPQFEGLFKAVDTSLMARFFYENNFIVNWMFPKGRV